MSITDKISGRVKQAAGDLLGDRDLHRKGKREETKGELKEEAARAEQQADLEEERARNERAKARVHEAQAERLDAAEDDPSRR
jgi:uncharacterized protein YjbJ (UPF0337 family)